MADDEAITRETTGRCYALLCCPARNSIEKSQRRCTVRYSTRARYRYGRVRTYVGGEGETETWRARRSVQRHPLRVFLTSHSFLVTQRMRSLKRRDLLVLIASSWRVEEESALLLTCNTVTCSEQPRFACPCRSFEVERSEHKERHRSTQARRLEARPEGAVASANEDSSRIESNTGGDCCGRARFRIHSWFASCWFCWRGLLLLVLAIFWIQQQQQRNFECFLRSVVSLRRSRGTKEE